MAVTVVGAVVHDGIRIELQRRKYTELGEEVEGAVHGGAVGPWFCRVDGVEDLGRGEVMLAGAEDRFEHGSAGRSDTAALGSDLRQRVLELVAHARTVRQLRSYCTWIATSLESGALRLDRNCVVSPRWTEDLSMHIPDGYLSPQTCATFGAAMVPAWYTAGRRVRKIVKSRYVPLLALGSAYCFLVMMFNVPIPDGTTAHAVGCGARRGAAGSVGRGHRGQHGAC